MSFTFSFYDEGPALIESLPEQYRLFAYIILFIFLGVILYVGFKLTKDEEEIE